MTQKAIVITGMGKQYRIGAQQKQYQTFQEVLIDALKTPFRRARSVLREGSAFLSDDTFWALNDINFEVERGEIVGVIGHNGAGKSTLLKILSRITRPTVGQALVNGRMGSLLEVGTGFHPELTGRENVYLNGVILGMKQREVDDKFDEIVEFAGVGDFIDTQVKHYSSGMALRLGFAVAAHLETDILVIDEVLAVGDAEFQRRCLGKIGDIAGKGRTVLFVSHNMTAVQGLCERSIWLDKGQIVDDGDTRSVISNYLSHNVTSKNEQRWDTPDEAPGNDKVRLHRVAVRADTQTELQIFSMETPLAIDIEYWNQSPGSVLNVTVHLIDKQGITVLGSSEIDHDHLANHALPGGLISSTCHISANLLNSGSYYVNVLIVENQSRVLFRIPYVIGFDVVDTATRKGWYGKRIGVVHPIFEWTVKPIRTTESEL